MSKVYFTNFRTTYRENLPMKLVRLVKQAGMLENIDFENKNAEYAISLHMDAIGKGYAKFATNAILDIAFNKLKLNRVYLNVLSKNIRAIKFYEKYGFIFEGESKEHLFHKGNFESLRWYRILASEKEAMDKS